MGEIRNASQEDLKVISDRFYTEDGVLYYKIDVGKVKKGSAAGCNSGSGYLQVYIKGKSWGVHRIIYFLSSGVWPGKQQIDHIDGNKTNNSFENLRLVDSQGNNRSFRTKSVGKSSSYRGVSYYKANGCWVSEVRFGSLRSRITGFTCPREAALVYNYEAQKAGFNSESFNKVFEDVSEEITDGET